MANSFVMIELDKARNLRFGYKALLLIEKKLGKFSNLDLSNVGFEDMAVILHAGLVHEDKELTLDNLIDIIDEHSNIEDIANKVTEAFEVSFGKNKIAPTEIK